MKIKEIRDLIDFISQSELNEVNIETTDFKISVKKSPDISVNSGELMIPPPNAQAIAPVASNISETVELKRDTAEEKAGPAKNLKEVKSPMIGTFYRAANPESNDPVYSCASSGQYTSVANSARSGSPAWAA